VINEAAARLIGLPDPVNHILYEMPHPATAKPNIWKIIGVVKDFNFNSLREQVTPLVLVPGGEQGSMAFRIHSHNVTGLVAEVEARWKKMAPMQAFSYSFMDNDFNALYKSENRMGQISICFSVLAIFIACLGLFGLAAYAAEQRTRDRRAKGIGGDCDEYCHSFVAGFFGAGGDFCGDRVAGILVVYAPMAAGFCVPHFDRVAGLWAGGVACYADCFADGEPAGG